MFSPLKMKTREKCIVVVNYYSVPKQDGHNIMMMRKVEVDRNRPDIPKELFEEISEYIDDDYVLLIAHKNVVRSF